MPRLTLRDLALLRLRNQRLIANPCVTLEEVLGWLGAVQAQDYYGAKWALASRLRRARSFEPPRLVPGSCFWPWGYA